MLEFLNVVKVYWGGVRGVDGVTMRLGPGLVGLLGPNGAGKSSLMRIGATVTRPTSGQVLFDGTDAVARPNMLRRNLGYLPQDFGVYPHLSAREFLSYLAAVKGLPARDARRRIGELLELLDLAACVISLVPSGTLTCATVTASSWSIAENKVTLSFSSVHAPRSTFPSSAITQSPLSSSLLARAKIHAQVIASSLSASILVSTYRIADFPGKV